jgi:hypothetical protein
MGPDFRRDDGSSSIRVGRIGLSVRLGRAWPGHPRHDFEAFCGFSGTLEGIVRLQGAGVLDSPQPE